MFYNRLTKVYRHRTKQAKQGGITCYRIYDRDLPEFPWIIEKYEDIAFASEYQTKHQLDEQDYMLWVHISREVICQVLNLTEEQLYLRHRTPKNHQLEQYEKLNTLKKNFIVHEGSLKFILNLTDYLDTGLFLDHRITRGMVRSISHGRRVLNLFSYTGSFSVYAAAGGATEILSIDLSNTYLHWSIRNMQINKLENKSKYRFLKADIFEVLPSLQDGYYDLVILDPPTFSNSKMMRGTLDIQRDHEVLINMVLNKMNAGGTLFFSTNARRFDLHEHKIKNALIEDITKATTPFDFNGKLQRPCYKIIKM